MSSSAILSIAVPVHINADAPQRYRLNRIELLIKCLESIILSVEHSGVGVDVCVIDDHSAVELAELVQDRINDAIRIIKNEGARGQAGALNYYLSICQSDVVAITDSDCVVSNDWVTTAFELINANQRASAICGPNWRHAYNGGVLSRILTFFETSLMRLYFRQRISSDGKRVDRFDCRNLILNIATFSEVARSKVFFVENCGPSVSGVGSHIIRKKYIETGLTHFAFSDKLVTHHAPITGIVNQVTTYFNRGRNGDFNKIYKDGYCSICGALFGRYIWYHFLLPIFSFPIGAAYVLAVHSAYWIGIIMKEIADNENAKNTSG